MSSMYEPLRWKKKHLQESQSVTFYPEPNPSLDVLANLLTTANGYFGWISFERPGDDFTNIFMLSFCARRSRKRKKIDDLTVFFTLLGSVSVKVVRKTLMQFSPGDDFTKILNKRRYQKRK